MPHALRFTAATFLIFTIGVSSCVGLRSRDLDDPGDADLTLEPASTASGEDGYVHLERAVARLDYPGDNDFDARAVRVLGGEQELDARILAVLATNRAALEEAHRACAARDLRIPKRTQEQFGVVGYLQLARLLAFDALLHAREGREQQSLRASLEAIELGYRLENAPGAMLLDVLAGETLKNIGGAALRCSLTRIQIESADARRIATALGAYRSSPEGWSRAWAAEYRYTTEPIVRNGWTGTDFSPFADGFALDPLAWLPHAYIYQPNRTLKAFAETHRVAQRASALPCARIPKDAPAPDGWTHVVRLLDRNGAGNALFDLARIDRRGFHERRCLVDTGLAASQAMLGLRAYELEHGELPESLEQLVPRYLASLPRDGFDDAPLRYSRSSPWLSSPGTDGVDRGGDAGPIEGVSTAFALEPTYRIRF